MDTARGWRSHAGAVSGETIAVVVIVAAVIAAVWAFAIDDEDDDEVTDAEEEQVLETVAGIEELGDLTLPEAAGEVEVSAVGESASRRAVFTLPTAELEPWCRELGLGQPLVRAREVEPEDRERFGIPPDAEVGDVRSCEGSAPEDPRVQRAIIATGAEGDEVTVHLVVQVFPVR